MAADSGDSSGIKVASPERPDPGPRPGRRTWWILPYFAGALAVFLVAGVVIGVHRATEPAAPAPSSSAAAAVMPAEEFPDALMGKLTADIQAGQEAAFLGLASAAARPAMTSWWDNLRAIGFTTGAVIPTAAFDAVHINSHGDGTAVVLAGAHSPLDPDSVNGKPDIPMARYRIGLHFASPGASGQITSWQPLDDTPWDSGSPLYVRKAQYVTVAGPAADRALVDQTLPAAEAAAAYDIKLMRHNASSLLEQQGFVAFVSGNATASDPWLASVPQLAGWPPKFQGVRAVQLSGPGVSADRDVARGTSGLVSDIADNTMGGVRLVLAPPATGETAHDETITLVGEFMLDVTGAQDEELANGIPLHTVGSWAEQGLAVMVESLFESNPNPTASEYSISTLTKELRALPKSYRSGSYPTTQQLFGPSVAADKDWGYVAASTYEYIAVQNNMSVMLASGMQLYTSHPTPFGNVYKSGNSAANFKVYGIHSIRLGWAPWLASL